MAGFTAINAASIRPRPTETQPEHAEDGGQAGFQSVASSYLGRDNNEATATASSQALHGPGAKKASGTGRKRSATASKDASSTKRHKTADVSEGMTVTKPDKRGAKKAAPKAPEQPIPGVMPNANTRDAIPIRSLPVYAQPTSMDMIMSSGQQTSMQAVRSAVGPACTLYNTGAPSGSTSAVEITQPWLDIVNVDKTNPTQAQDLPDNPEGADAAAPSPARICITASTNQLPTPFASDSTANETSPNGRGPQTAREPHAHSTHSDDFIDIDDHDKADLIDLTTAVEETMGIRERTPPFRERKQNIRAVEEHEDYGGALLTDTEKQHLEGLRMSLSDANRPIVRKPFPQAVLDRSPIFGASAKTVLSTCFRVGEALNTGAQAVRTNKNVLLELYCRVTQSWREPKPGRKQHFVFKDLYHDNPPHLNGTFELWDQSRLWDLDSAAFLTPKPEGTMARIIARMKRDGQKWRLEVLNIWEASWEDVEHIAGIYVR